MKNPIVSIKFKNFGEVKIELYPKHAKECVNNFITLINKGYYDNKSICRVVNKRLIQSGDSHLDPKNWTDDNPGYALNGEFNRDDYVNELSFTRGTVGMAMAADHITPYSTAGSFFIMTRDESKLDAIVPAFGRVISGMDVVDDINTVKTHDDYGYDAPLDVIDIESISVESFNVSYPEPEKVDLKQV